MAIGVKDQTSWRKVIPKKKTVALHSHSSLSFSKNINS